MDVAPLELALLAIALGLGLGATITGFYSYTALNARIEQLENKQPSDEP